MRLPAIFIQKEVMKATYSNCIKACQQCSVACQECLAAMAGKESNTDCPLCCELCMDSCLVAVKFMAADNEFAIDYCKACMDVCAWCAEQCMKHDERHCRECAEFCLRSIEQCRKVVLEGDMV